MREVFHVISREDRKQIKNIVRYFKRNVYFCSQTNEQDYGEPNEQDRTLEFMRKKLSCHFWMIHSYILRSKIVQTSSIFRLYWFLKLHFRTRQAMKRSVSPTQRAKFVFSQTYLLLNPHERILNVFLVIFFFCFLP